MIARVIWFAALIAVGLVTTALQIDKQSDTDPALATLVPGPLRNFAQTQIAKTTLAGDDAATALLETERLVRRRPVPSEYLTLLAIAQTKAGQPEQGVQTIQIAAQRGWRDPMAQQAVLRLAVAADDQAEAARRYAALMLQQSTPDALLIEFGPAVLGEPGGVGQQTLTAIVVGTERWHDRFLRRGAQVMPPAAFSAIARQSIEQGAAFECMVLGQGITALKRRDAAEAYRLAMTAGERLCPRLAPARADKPAL